MPQIKEVIVSAKWKHDRFPSYTFWPAPKYQLNKYELNFYWAMIVAQLAE